jgi:hypothetical protein
MALKALTTAVATYDKIVRAAATPATFFEVVFSKTFTFNQNSYDNKIGNSCL